MDVQVAHRSLDYSQWLYRWIQMQKKARKSTNLAVLQPVKEGETHERVQKAKRILSNGDMGIIDQGDHRCEDGGGGRCSKSQAKIPVNSWGIQCQWMALLNLLNSWETNRKHSWPFRPYQESVVWQRCRQGKRTHLLQDLGNRGPNDNWSGCDTRWTNFSHF